MERTYIVNGRYLKCERTSRKHDNHGHERFPSKNEQTCDKISSITALAHYNMKRLKKLNDEYKCSPLYSGSEKKLAGFSLYNCNSDVYKALTEKFNTVLVNVINVNRLLDNKNINTREAKAANSEAIKAIHNLEEFTSQHKEEVNKAFELAYYDTNIAGVATFFTSLFMPYIGIPAAVGNQFYNNEFDGKISRAYDNAESLEQTLEYFA